MGNRDDNHVDNRYDNHEMLIWDNRYDNHVDNICGNHHDNVFYSRVIFRLARTYHLMLFSIHFALIDHLAYCLHLP